MNDRIGPSISMEKRALFWILGLAVFGLLLYVLSGVLVPFVAGLAVAYFFDPVADRLEKAGVSRGLAAAVVIAGFLALAGALLVLIYPLLQGQVVGLIAHIPELIDAAREQSAPLLETLNERLSSGQISDLKGTAGSYAGNALGWLGGLLQDVWSGGLAFFNLLSLLIITPLVAFYLLRDWDRIVAHFDGLLPRRSAVTIREQATAIDATLAAFVRGQASVCFVLGIFYATGLTIIGLDFGLLVGLGTGIISFVPYVGAGIGMLTGVGIALFQFPETTSVIIVAAIFFVGQTAESYFLTPKLVGDRVGLHPVWIVFALLAGGALFGFTGVLLAVPVTAVIGVLVRFATARYLESPLYGGEGS